MITSRSEAAFLCAMPFSSVILQVLEWTAVVLNVAFTLCIAYEKRIGWVLGFVAGLIGVGLYSLAHTWAMGALNVYYVAMAVYGWWSWGRDDQEQSIRTRPLWFHAVLIVAGLLLSYAIYVLLAQYLDGHFPQLDAFVTVTPARAMAEARMRSRCSP